MNFLDALFSGAKALLKELVDFGGSLVREVLREIDNSSFGKAATRAVSGVADRVFGSAQDLAGEEAELAAKAQRDGRRTDADAQRLREIEAERDRLRAELDKANSDRKKEEFKKRVNEVDAHVLEDDELSANVGLMALKACPVCGGQMQIGQGVLSINTHKRYFFWQCTSIRRIPCPRITFHPELERSAVVRPDSADFDMPIVARHTAWESQPVLNETHARVRQHLGDDDKELICPKHLLPLKLLPKQRQGGKLLDSYEYVCLGVNSDGSACTHKVTLQTMPQVVTMLERTEGRGIL